MPTIVHQSIIARCVGVSWRVNRCAVASVDKRHTLGLGSCTFARRVCTTKALWPAQLKAMNEYKKALQERIRDLMDNDND